MQGQARVLCSSYPVSATLRYLLCQKPTPACHHTFMFMNMRVRRLFTNACVAYATLWLKCARGVLPKSISRFGIRRKQFLPAFKLMLCTHEFARL